MRSLSLVNSLNFKDIYTTNSKNLCLFDVDSDGENELIVGYWDSGRLLETGEADVEASTGVICVLKHRNLWKINYEIGMVLCVTAGNIIGNTEPWILALCADSHVYAFDARIESSSTPPSQDPLDTSAIKPTSSKDKPLQNSTLKVVHHQLLAYNAKDILIYNNDGFCEIAVAHSDRIVRLYTWCSSKSNLQNDEEYTIVHGHFVILMKWELAGQVNSVSVHPTLNSGNLLLASQPGGGFAILQKKFEKYHDEIVPTLLYYPSGIANTRNHDARTWIVGGVRAESIAEPPTDGTEEPASQLSKSKFIVGVCMADGTVHLIDPDADQDKERLIWTTQLHFRGELFGLSKVCLTPSDSDELCACSWDGTTYVFNHRKEILRYPMGQSCQAFLAGLYAVEPGRNEPVFVYSTCERNLLVYYGLQVDRLTEPDLLSSICNNESIASKLRTLNIDPTNREQLREAVQRYLYKTKK